MIKNWKLIFMHMMNYAEDATNRAADRAKAKGIITKFRQHKFVWYLHFVADVLDEVAKISLLFQRNDINVSSAATNLEAAHLTLHNMLANKGTHLHAFDIGVVVDQFRDHTLLNVVDAAPLEMEKRSIVQDLLDCIQTRFDNL